jgi:hypothetical protein
VPPVIEAINVVGQFRIQNQVDEALLSEIDRRGNLDEWCAARMDTQLQLAIEAGSDVIVTTCNAYSTVVMARLRPKRPDVPIVIIDEPMIQYALSQGAFTVVGTVPAGLASQREMVNALSHSANALDVDYALCDNALSALRAGDQKTHDRILVETALACLSSRPLVVFAQASMSRVHQQLPLEVQDRVLTSPPWAAREVARLLCPAPDALAA